MTSESNMKLSQSATVDTSLIVKGVFSILLIGTVRIQIGLVKTIFSDTSNDPDTRSSSTMMSAEYLGTGGTDATFGQEIDVIPLLSSRISATLLSSTLYRDTYRYIAPLGAASPKFASSNPKDVCGSEPNFETFFATNDHGRSKENEDRIIYDTFFKDYIARIPLFKGSYVEVGSFDGRSESNTRFFDRCLGWEGLLIDANPQMYDKTNANRPYAHRVNFSPSCKKSGETVKFAATESSNSGLVGYAKAFDKAEEYYVDVPCGPLSPLLVDMFANRGKDINFFSLSVEAAEELVLNTIDLDKVHIDILMIEAKCEYATEEKCSRRDKIRTKMYDSGYMIHTGIVSKSDVYVHPVSSFRS